MLRYILGDPMDHKTLVGPVISRASKKAIDAQVQDALSKGAVNVTPENASFKNPPPAGNYVVPTILINVDHSMVVMQEETFGPIIPVAKVASDADAITLMNDTEYGLTASVWTKDISRGHEIIEQLQVGTVFINRCDYPNPVSAFLGSIGRQNGYLDMLMLSLRTLPGPDGRNLALAVPLGPEGSISLSNSRAIISRKASHEVRHLQSPNVP